MRTLILLILLIFFNKISAQNIEQISGYVLKYKFKKTLSHDHFQSKEVLLQFNDITDEGVVKIFQKIVSSPDTLLKYITNSNLIFLDIDDMQNIDSVNKRKSQKISEAYHAWKNFSDKTFPKLYFRGLWLEVQGTPFQYSIEISIYKLFENMTVKITPITSSRGENCCGHFYSNKYHVLFENNIHEPINGYIITKFE